MLKPLQCCTGEDGERGVIQFGQGNQRQVRVCFSSGERAWNESNVYMIGSKEQGFCGQLAVVG